MHEYPPLAPTFHSSLSIGAMLAIGMLLLAAIMMASAYFSGRRRLAIGRGLWNVLATAMWTLPGVAVLAGLAIASSDNFRDTREISAPSLASRLGQAEAPWNSLDNQGQLREVSTGSDSLPEWVRNRFVDEGESLSVVLTSKQYAAIAQAEQELAPTVEDIVRTYFHQAYPDRGAWELPVQVVASEAVAQQYVEPLQHDFGRFTGEMYRVHQRVRLTPELRDRLYPTWRAQIVQRRLIILAALFGLATLMVGASAIYFLLDAVTAGVYRGRLKLAAASLAVAGSLAVSVWLV